MEFVSDPYSFGFATGTMLGFKPRTPLTDFLIAVGPESIQRTVEQKKNDANCLATAISLIVVATAGHFMSKSWQGIKLKIARPDVVAFEALAFSAYAVRDAYSPLSSDDVDVPDTVAEGFRDAFGVCNSIVTRFAGWQTTDLFENRMLGYGGSGVGENKPAERFAAILQTIGDAKAPCTQYATPQMDLRKTLSAMAGVHSFAATIPKGYAESLRSIVEHFDLR